MADKQDAPAFDDDPVGISPDAALDALLNSPGALDPMSDEEFDVSETGLENAEDRRILELDQAETQSEGEEEAEDDTTAEEDDQGDDQSDEESEEEDELSLFTLGEDGKPEAIDLDDLEVDLTVDGQEQALQISELKAGYLRQQDYTRKTQDVAARVAEDVAAEREKLSADFSGRVQQVEQIVEAFGTVFDQEPSFEQMKARYNGDDAQAWKAMNKWRESADKMANARFLIQKKEEDAEARYISERQDNIRSTIKVLRDTVPEWKDDAKFDADSSSMRNFMLKNGLNDDDIVEVLQKPGYVMMIRDAMVGSEIRTKKPSVTKRRRKVTKAVKKSAGTLKVDGGRGQALARIRKRTQQGDEASALALIEAGL